MSENPDETAERSTGLMHVAKTLFPAEGLAPWMTRAEKRVLLGLALMDTISDLGEELERRIWLDEQDGKAPQPDGKTLEMQPASNGSWKLDYENAGSEEATPAVSNPPAQIQGAPEPPDFDVTERRGGIALISFFNRQFARNLRNGLPAEKGMARREALHLGAAQKTGVAVEPKPRSRWEKLTGKGKERGQIAGVE